MSDNKLFDGLDMAELMGENERLSSEGQQDFLNNFVRMPEGNGFVTVRLMPPAKGKRFYCATRTHKVHGKNVHCPRMLVSNRWVDEDPKQPCVICKYYNELWKKSESKEGKEKAELENQARAIKPIERYYYNCIVRTQTNPKTQQVEKNVGPKILSIGKQLHQRIIRAIVGDPQKEEAPLGDVTHPFKGRDFKIIKTVKPGKDAFPEYHESKFAQETTPAGSPDEVAKWMTDLHDLAGLRVIKTRDEMAVELKKHLGIIKDDSTGFDMSEFQRPDAAPAASVEEQVRQARPSVPVQTEAAPKPQTQVLGDAAFLEELQNLKID